MLGLRMLDNDTAANVVCFSQTELYIYAPLINFFFFLPVECQKGTVLGSQSMGNHL